jgi:cell division septal protein FtsQ
VARVELPASRLKIRKRRRRLRILLICALAILLLLGFVAAAAYIPAIQIQTVAISGVQTISSTTLRAEVEEYIEGTYGYILPKRNIFLYPKHYIKDSLMREYPMFASVDVHAIDFQSIAVNVVERQPRALWCQTPPATGCYFMDENGVVYEKAPNFSEPIYLSYSGEAAGQGLPKQYLTPSEFQALSALVDATAHLLTQEDLLSVAVDRHGDVRARFASGFVLLFIMGDEGGDVFERLTLALKAEPLRGRELSAFEYLDLRFGDKLYYKLRE